LRGDIVTSFQRRRHLAKPRGIVGDTKCHGEASLGPRIDRFGMLKIRTSFLLVAFAVTSASFAIVIRHDRDDAKYRELAKQFKAYGDVVEAGSTLVDKSWLLTAGHVATTITPYSSFAVVGGHEYMIDRVVMHPDYIKDGYRGRRDVAMLHLTKPVTDVEPVLLYRKDDEAGQIVTFFGRGMTGNGQTGPTAQDTSMRGATNKLERVDDRSVFFLFDDPKTATEMEGISGPGDSGGPALLKVNGKWAIAGISSANSGGGSGICTYGTTEVYARVSPVVPWIEQTIKTLPASSINWRIVRASQGWPKSRFGEVGAALLAAFNTGDPVKMEEFNQKYRDPEALAGRTAEQRKDGYLGIFNKSGSLTVVEFATDPRGRTMTLLVNEKGEYFQLSLYFLDPDFKAFDGYWIGAGKPRA
jgi:hypothetical protein